MSLKKQPFSLRPAEASDTEFIFQLRRITMRPFFEHTHGWYDETERKNAEAHLDFARIVLVENQPVGVIKLVPGMSSFELHQVQILPEFQQLGIGAALVSDLIAQSTERQLPVTLFVMKSSPAKKLYEKFGFQIIENFKHHCKMIYRPDI